MRRLGAPATLIEYNYMRFVITYEPDKICRRKYIQDLQQYETRKLLNVTKSIYNTEIFTMAGITVENLYYPDGTFPDADTIEQWLLIVKQHFVVLPKTAIAVHDQSGLGRSAVLVALALMENGMKSQEAIDLIRMKRRGAFNAIQLEELGKYKPKQRLLEREKSKIFGKFRSKRISNTSEANVSNSKQTQSNI